MKKVFAVVLMLMIVMSVMTVAALADGTPELVVTTDKSVVENVGDVVNVSVALKNAPTASSIAFTLSCDGFEVVSGTETYPDCGSFMVKMFMANKVTLAGSPTGSGKDNATIFTVQLKATAVKDATITLTGVSGALKDYTKINPSVTAATISHAHSFTAEKTDSKYLVSAGTCTAEAVYYKSCSICGAAGTDTDTFKGAKDPANHSGTTKTGVDAVTATCSQEGHTGKTVWQCCDAVENEGESIAKTAHSYGAVTFTWKDDNSAVYSAKCGKCDHSEAGNAEVESNYTAATKCDEYGYTVYTASVDTVDARGTVITGSDTKTVKDAAPLGHDLKDVAAKAATCTEDGYTAHKDCSRCDYTEGKTVVGATGHDYEVSFTWASNGTSATYAAVCKKDNEHKLNGNATVKQTAGDEGNCQTMGSYTYTASVTIDGETYTDTKTVNGVYGKHNTEKVPAVTATCVKDGNVEHWHCDVCGKNFEEEACINELTEDEVVVEKGSNKNHPGLKTVLAVEPNCVEGGNIAYWYCPTCDTYFGDTYLENEINEADTKLEKDPTAHKDLKHFDAVAATCAATGHKEYWYCSACEAYYDKADGVAAVEAETLVTEKNAANHSELVFVPKAEGDCQTEGNIAYIYCKGCGLYWEAPEGFKAEDLTDEFDPANLTVIEDGQEGTKVPGNPDIHNKNCYGKDADGHWTTCGTENGEVEEHLMNVETTGGKKVSTCAVCGYQTIENISTGTTSPKTGDEANIALWTVLVLGCGAGAVLLSRKKKEN